MSEQYCAALLTLLVPLVGGLNAVLLKSVKDLQAQVGGRRSGSDEPSLPYEDQ